MRGVESTLFYFGFLRNDFPKSLFLLFCATLVFPFDRTDAFQIAIGYCLFVISALQMIKGCKTTEDTNDSEAILDTEKWWRVNQYLQKYRNSK